MTEPMIEAGALVKRFGSTTALAGIDLGAEKGTTLALLGPNGAGKTTLVRILTTLLKPDSGRASVAGYDVTADPGSVRSVIGLARPVRGGRRAAHRAGEPGARRVAVSPGPGGTPAPVTRAPGACRR